jgi:hypothetical protein
MITVEALKEINMKATGDPTDFEKVRAIVEVVLREPELLKIDVYGSFREYRVSELDGNTNKPMTTVYKQWHELCGHNDLVAEYVGRLGISRCECPPAETKGN